MPSLREAIALLMNISHLCPSIPFHCSQTAPSPYPRYPVSVPQSLLSGLIPSPCPTVFPLYMAPAPFLPRLSLLLPHFPSPCPQTPQPLLS